MTDSVIKKSVIIFLVFISVIIALYLLLNSNADQKLQGVGFSPNLIDARNQAHQALSQQIWVQVQSSSRYEKVWDGDRKEYFKAYIETRSSSRLFAASQEVQESEHGYRVIASLRLNKALKTYAARLRALLRDIQFHYTPQPGDTDLRQYQAYNEIARMVEEYNELFNMGALVNAIAGGDDSFENQYSPAELQLPNDLAQRMADIEIANSPVSDVDLMMEILNVKYLPATEICDYGLPFNSKTVTAPVISAVKRSLNAGKKEEAIKLIIPRITQNEKAQFVLELITVNESGANDVVLSSVVISEQLLELYSYPKVDVSRAILDTVQTLTNENAERVKSPNFISLLIRNQFTPSKSGIEKWIDAEPCKPIGILTNQELSQLYGASYLVQVKLDGIASQRDKRHYDGIEGLKMAANLYIDEYDLIGVAEKQSWHAPGKHPNVSELNSEFKKATEDAFKQLIDERLEALEESL